MTDLPDIQDTDLAPATEDIVALIQRLNEVSPNWRRLELVKDGAGEAILCVFKERGDPPDRQGVVVEFPVKAQKTL